MRTQTLARMIEECLEDTTDTMVSIRELETGDVNVPEPATVKARWPVQLQQLNAKERAARMAVFSEPVTHQCFARAVDELAIGCELLETHRKDEYGRWRIVHSDEAHTYVVRGIERVPGVPAPTDQVRLDLWQKTGTLTARR